MDLVSILRDGLRTLLRNKTRSLLTVLGLTIGIGAVICVAALGDASSYQIEQRLEALGDNYINVNAGSRAVGGVQSGANGTKSMTLSDADAIRQGIPTVKLVMPKLNGTAQLVYGNRNWSAPYRGASTEFFEIKRWPVEQGARFTDEDVELAANVCVLGRTVRDKLFAAEEDPIGKSIKLGTLPCVVVGILAVKGAAGGTDNDDIVMVPVTTVMKKIKGQTWIDSIWCSVVSNDAIPLANAQITALLRDRHRLRPGQPDDFTIHNAQESIEAQLETSRTFALFLICVGAVSLLVGGIGIMNVMLVSVTERTREIGVRMAVGATEAMVQFQFLGESIILSLVGGAVGVLLGIVGSFSLGKALDWQMRISLQSVLIAVGFSVLIGLFFGLYPARKASMLDPIEALRFE